MTELATAAVKTIKIEDIIVGNRFRKDLGNIDAFAKEIKDVGLLQPIGITPDNKLIYGARRIEAYKRLGWTEIPAYIIPLDDIIKGELIENTARKDFTFSERLAILEEIESKRIGHKLSKGANLAPFQEQEKGKKSRDIAAKYTDVSAAQIAKEKKIMQTVKQKPELEYIIDELDSCEMSVNEADERIKFHQDLAAEEEEKGARRKLKQQVMKEDDYKCRDCGDKSRLDVYPISDTFQDKYIQENLETLCKDCHDIKKKFFGEFGLVNAFLYMFQKLTGMSGRRYFQYNTIGSLDSNNESSDYMRSWLKEEEQNPYTKLKRSSYDELVSKTRRIREQLIQSLPFGDDSVYITQDVLSQLVPILMDYQKMIDKEAEDRRRRKHEISKR